MPLFSFTRPNPNAPPARPPYGLFIAIGFVLVILGGSIRFLIQSQSPVTSEPLPHFTAVPPFQLTERSGRPIGNADLSGKICIVDFFFSTCPGPCPVMSNNMSKLQQAFMNDPKVQLVSITVDPDDDTQAVLSTYADRYHADKDKWLFLTGNEATIHKLVSDGFYQPVSDNRGQTLQPGQYLFTHSTEFVVVDPHGIIRAYYHGTDQDGTLLYDIKGAVKNLERE